MQSQCYIKVLKIKECGAAWGESFCEGVGHRVRLKKVGMMGEDGQQAERARTTGEPLW